MSKSFLVVTVLLFGIIAFTVVDLLAPLQACRAQSSLMYDAQGLMNPGQAAAKQADQECEVARKKGNIAEKMLRQLS